MFNLKSSHKQDGFTLVELSVVVVVIGLLLAALLNLYMSYSKQQQIITTADNIKAAQEALQSFKDRTGYYPCPADPADPGAKATDCSAAASGGIVVAAGDGGRAVRIGVMPIVDLSGDNKLIQKSQSVDGWRNRLSYAVTEGLAVGGAANVSTLGAIRVVNAAGAEQTARGGYVLFSHGDDGNGAYSASGQHVSACNPANRDAENCNGDATFLSDKRSYGEGQYTDDYLDFDTATVTDPLGPCTEYLNLNSNVQSQEYAGGPIWPRSAVGVMNYSQAITVLGGEALYYGIYPEVLDYDNTFNGYGTAGAPGTGTGIGLGQFEPPPRITINTPQNLSRLFEFKAVNPRTGAVICVITQKNPPPAATENGGSHGSGEGGNAGDGGD